jgi:PIN domain nuclease of toxin-antitoxin system
VIAYLDTQVVVWLYRDATRKLSSEARRRIEKSDLRLSPMVLLELKLLYDRKRVRYEPLPILAYLTATAGLAICDLPFASVVVESLSINWTDDPFDRLIVAQAIANQDAPLITADQHILEHYMSAVW